jgi:hypothetical protein
MAGWQADRLMMMAVVINAFFVWLLADHGCNCIYSATAPYRTLPIPLIRSSSTGSPPADSAHGGSSPPFCANHTQSPGLACCISHLGPAPLQPPLLRYSTP